MSGLAGIHADMFDALPLGLCLWDGRTGDGPGGTASAVEAWRQQGIKVDTIDLGSMLEAQFGTQAIETEQQPTNPCGAQTQNDETALAVMLFADVKGFSKLREDEIPRFVEHFLGKIGSMAQRSAHKPLVKNTWGDGLYFVFSSVAEAGFFALELSELLRATDWRKHELPAELGIRIALHIGPVYDCTDPVTGQRNFMGTHVSRAARIEPITPPGQVYGSQAFAAMAQVGKANFLCTYVGQIPLAKGYGTFATYHIRERT